MPIKDKGKRKLTAGPMDPRKTREPVTGHPDSDLNAALDSILLSPPPVTGYDSDTSMFTTTTAVLPPPPTAPPLPRPTPAELAKVDKWVAGLVMPKRPSLRSAFNHIVQKIGTRVNAEVPRADLFKITWCMREVISFLQHDPSEYLGENLKHADIYQRQRLLATTTEATTQTATPPTLSYAEAATSTDSPPTRSYAEAATSTTPTRSYAEAATQATPPLSAQHKTTTPQPKDAKGKGKVTTAATTTPQSKDTKGRGTGNTSQQARPTPPYVHSDRAVLIAPPANATPGSPTCTSKRTPPPQGPLVQARTIVLHGAPTRYKPGQMRCWIEEDNKNITVLGIRWLLQEPRRTGKVASSLVIYMGETININKGVRMGRGVFRTTQYDWER